MFYFLNASILLLQSLIGQIEVGEWLGTLNNFTALSDVRYSYSYILQISNRDSVLHNEKLGSKAICSYTSTLLISNSILYQLHSSINIITIPSRKLVQKLFRRNCCLNDESDTDK